MAKPTTLKEFYKQQQAIFEPPQSIPGPDYKDVETVTEQEIEDYILSSSTAAHRERQVKKLIVNALRTLSDDKLKQIYGRIKGPNPHPMGTERGFIESVRKGSGRAVLSPARYDSDLDTMLDVYGEALGKEKVREIINSPIPAYAASPEYTDPKVYEPYANDIQKLRDRYTKTDDPAKNAQAAELIDRVSVSLQEVKPEILEVYNTPRTNGTVANYTSYDDIVGRRVDIMRADGLESLGDGAFKGLVKPSMSIDGTPDFNMMNGSQYPVPMTEEQERKLAELSRDKNIGLSEDTRSALKELSQCMDELDFSVIGMPLSGQSFPPHKPKENGEKYYQAEQGEKYYAFWPLEAAKRDLRTAVKSGDIEQVRLAQEKYEKVEKTMDRAFEILKSKKLYGGPLFGPNLESTRSSTGDLPEKYALDTTNQKKLNGLFIAYTQLKSAGLTLEDLVSDPVGTAKKLSRGMLEAGSLDSRSGSIGASLQHGLKGSFAVGSPDLQLHYAWNNLDGALHRGISGIVGMEKDVKRRGEFMAAFHLGMRQATTPIKEEISRYKTVSDVLSLNDEKHVNMRSTIYRNAALRPETGKDCFDLKRMIDNFGRPDVSLDPGVPLAQASPERIRYSWQDDMDAANRIADGTGEYDWKELAGRNEKVIRDAEREELLSGSYKSSFNKDSYLLNAFAVQSRLMKNAAAHGENSPEFREFCDSVKNTYRLAKDPSSKLALKLGAELAEDPEAFDFLKTGKDDQIIKSDSDEYVKMKQSLASVRLAAEFVAGGEPMKLEAVSNTDIPKYLEEAKQDAFNYARLKMKNGTKTSFYYTSGRERAKEGLNNYTKLAALQDKLGLRSPAQKVYEDARMELLLNRGREGWLTSEAGRNALAKMLYAKPFLDAKIPAEHQKAAFEPAALKNSTDRLRTNSLGVYQSPAELNGLADDALQNKGLFKEFTDQYAAARKEIYSKVTDRQVRQDCIRGFAMDEAARRLKLDHQSQTYDDRNPEIRQKADEVMREPLFRATMLKLMEGKTTSEIKALHEPARLQNDPAVQSAFERAQTKAMFEKRCASVAAEAMLRSKAPDREPTQEEIDNAAGVLLKDARFGAFVREKEGALDSYEEYENAMNELELPEKRSRFLSEMSKRVTEPIPQANGRNAGHAEPIVNGPEMRHTN